MLLEIRKMVHFSGQRVGEVERLKMKVYYRTSSQEPSSAKPIQSRNGILLLAGVILAGLIMLQADEDGSGKPFPLLVAIGSEAAYAASAAIMGENKAIADFSRLVTLMGLLWFVLSQ
jgi:hypothetical protein